MRIENQNIYGGSQNFADTIVNNSNTLEESDKVLIKLIHTNIPNQDERLQLIEDIESMKLDDSTTSKEQSKSRLAKFIDTGLTEASKQIVKEMIENGASYLDGLI